MATNPNRKTGGTQEQAPKPGVMSHQEKPQSLANMLHGNRVYRDRFWNLFKTLQRVERGEI